MRKTRTKRFYTRSFEATRYRFAKTQVLPLETKTITPARTIQATIVILLISILVLRFLFKSFSNPAAALANFRNDPGSDYSAPGSQLRDELRDDANFISSLPAFPSLPSSVFVGVDLGRGLRIDPNPYAIGLSPYGTPLGDTGYTRTSTTEVGGVPFTTQTNGNGPQVSTGLVGFKGLPKYPLRAGPYINASSGSRSTTTQIGPDWLNCQVTAYSEGPSTFDFGGLNGRWYVNARAFALGGGTAINVGPFGAALAGRIAPTMEWTEGGRGPVLGQLKVVVGQSTSLSNINTGTPPQEQFYDPNSRLRSDYPQGVDVGHGL